MGKITIIGLGAGDLSQLSLGVYEKLIANKQIYVRTAEHPVVSQLLERGLNIHSFDVMYEQVADFSEVYEGIANELVEKARQGESLLFAVPGHPLVAEQTTWLLLDKGKRAGVEVDLQEGHSFL